MAKFCTECGKPIADGVMFCTECGAKASVENTSPPAAPQKAEPIREAKPQEVKQPQQQNPIPQPVQQPIPQPVQQPTPPPVYQQTYNQQQYQQPVYQQPVYQQQQSNTSELNVDGTKYEPITTGGYIGIMLLLCIPVVGLILMIVWACGGCRKINKRNLCRSILIMALIGAVLTLIITLAFGGLIQSALGSFGL